MFIFTLGNHCSTTGTCTGHSHSIITSSVYIQRVVFEFRLKFVYLQLLRVVTSWV